MKVEAVPKSSRVASEQERKIVNFITILLSGVRNSIENRGGW